jgi:hypothetical protein
MCAGRECLNVQQPQSKQTAVQQVRSSSAVGRTGDGTPQGNSNRRSSWLDGLKMPTLSGRSALNVQKPAPVGGGAPRRTKRDKYDKYSASTVKYSASTVKELRATATACAIPGRSRMSKAQLIQRLKRQSTR